MFDKKNYEIVKHVAVLSSRGTWKKEVNLIKWYGKGPKYDIREWNESHTEMSKGITLSEKELQILLKTFFSMDKNLVDVLGNNVEKDVEKELDAILNQIFAI